MAPLRLKSSEPSRAPPPSVSARSGSVFVAPLSASGRQWPRATLVAAFEQPRPSSVPSYSPSLSLSGSRALMAPSPSLSWSKLGSCPSITPSSSLSASLGSVPIARSRTSVIPSLSLSAHEPAAPGHEHTPVPVVHCGAVTRQSVLVTQPTQAPVEVLQAGVPPVHWVLFVREHCPHAPLGSHAGTA